jgi:hypothetical protein
MPSAAATDLIMKRNIVITSTTTESLTITKRKIISIRYANTTIGVSEQDRECGGRRNR